jgi:hypothetical protein
LVARATTDAEQSATHVLADPLAMLLSNLTKLDSVAASLISMQLYEDVSAIDALVEVFVTGDNGAHNKNASYHFLASVLANLSIVRREERVLRVPELDTAQSPVGRATLLAKTRPATPAEACAIARMAVFTEHPDLIRRGGVASAIKCVLARLCPGPNVDAAAHRNCCFDKDAHLDLVAQDRYNVLPRLLLPLCGPEEFELEVHPARGASL